MSQLTHNNNNNAAVPPMDPVGLLGTLGGVSGMGGGGGVDTTIGGVGVGVVGDNDIHDHTDALDAAAANFVRAQQQQQKHTTTIGDIIAHHHHGRDEEEDEDDEDDDEGDDGSLEDDEDLPPPLPPRKKRRGNDKDSEDDDEDDDDDDENNLDGSNGKVSRRQQPPKTNITRTRYSNDFKMRVVSELEEPGYTLTDISKHYGVAEQTLRDWMKHKDKIEQAVQRRGNMKANPVDHLKHVTAALIKFMDEHYSTRGNQPTITARMIAHKGNEIRKQILDQDARNVSESCVFRTVQFVRVVA